MPSTRIQSPYVRTQQANVRTRCLPPLSPTRENAAMNFQNRPIFFSDAFGASLRRSPSATVTYCLCNFCHPAVRLTFIFWVGQQRSDVPPPDALTEQSLCTMGKLCCCAAEPPMEEVFSDAASPQHSPQQRSSSPVITPQRLRSSNSLKEASVPGGGIRRQSSALRFDAQHGVQRDRSVSSSRERAKLNVAIAVVNTSNRLTRQTEAAVDRKHSVWVMAEGTRIAADSAVRGKHLDCVAARQSSRQSSGGAVLPLVESAAN